MEQPQRTQQQWVKDIMFNIITLMGENKYNGDFFQKDTDMQ